MARGLWSRKKDPGFNFYARIFLYVYMYIKMWSYLYALVNVYTRVLYILAYI